MRLHRHSGAWMGSNSVRSMEQASTSARSNLSGNQGHMDELDPFAGKTRGVLPLWVSCHSMLACAAGH